MSPEATRRPRVLHVITGLGIGGAEQQLRLLLRHLGAECEVVALREAGVVAEGIRADGTPVVDLGMGGNRDLRALPRLVGLMRAGRYDVVHTHLYRACVYGRVAARLAGVRAVVATEHSLGESQIEGRPLTRGTRALYRGTERLGTATVAVSATVAQRLEAWGVPAQRVHLVPNGIDPDDFRFAPATRAATRAQLGLAQDAFVVGGVGRLVPGKRFDTLVRAVAATPGTDLLLAGDGPERPVLLALAAKLRASGRVHLVGATPDVPALLAAMDVFVSPSREEAFGLAVVEALASGLPVLHVACPAVDDLPASHAPGARRIGATQQDLVSALRAQLEAGARRFPVPRAVDGYHIAHTADRVMALYTAAAATRPGRKK
ncbi:glycosyltransferase [Streptomyces sp. NPDC051976]|uniref:glycosyltransferase n=1 Tax=Streptomyces sp. NPDC051976 TaxID=3154947 RepID=UPI0034473450